MHGLTTERLRFRKFLKKDAGFVRQLLNEPGYLEYVGDRGIRTLAEARTYIAEKFSYGSEEFGFYVIEGRKTGEPLGFAGIVARDFLDSPDVGYALLQRFEGLGLATEAARAARDFGFETLGLDEVGAIVSPVNAASIAVVTKLGMIYRKKIEFPATGDELNFYSVSRI